MDGVRVSEHASERGSWRISSLAPSGLAALHVSAFHAYEERGTRRFAADASCRTALRCLIFNLGRELRVEHPLGALHAFGKGQDFFSGASRTYAITETDGAQTGAQVKFGLLGARLFLGRPLGELGDTLVDLSQAFGRSAGELEERVADARSQEERLQLLSRAVEMRLRSEDAIAPDLAFAFRRLDRADVRIVEVACEIGMSRECLESVPPRVGLTPKTSLGCRRFARALRARRLEPSLDGAALAASVRRRRSGRYDPRFPGIRRQPQHRPRYGGANYPKREASSTDPAPSHFQDPAALRAPRA